jgi:hypothetical protein
MRSALLLVALAAAPVLAQEDDELPALPNAKPKPKPARPKPKPPAKKPAATAPAADDELPALPALKGDLVVKLATPMKGAKLTVDDKEIGQLPQAAQTVTAGEHTVTVRRLGFALFSKKITIVANKPSEVSVTLEPVAAVVTVSCDVVGAQVFVNGRLAGSAPLIDLEVPPGNVEIAVKKDGYHDGAQTLAAKAGRDYPLEVKLGAPLSSAAVATESDAPVNRELEPTNVAVSEPVASTETQVESAPLYQKWWFWTAAVIVVGGIVAGTVVGVNLRAQNTALHKNDFPCQQNGMTCDGWVNVQSIVPLGHGLH